MARPGVTYSEVVEAAAQLIGEGKNPTIEQIRRLIGNGSNSTLANHLRRWKAEQAGDSVLASKENIPPALISTLKGLWEGVLHEAEAKVVAAATGYEAVIEDLKEALEKYKSNNQRWQKLHDQWLQEKEKQQLEITAQTEQITIFKQQYNALETRWETQTKQLEEKEARIVELNQLHLQVQHNLEHYRESVREQRLADLLATEKREAVLQQEIADLKAALAGSEAGRREAEQAYSVSKMENTHLNERLAQMQNEREHLLDAKRIEENKHIRLQAEYDCIVKREEALHDRYVEAQNRIISLEKSKAMLDAQLHSIQEAMSRMEDKMSTLEHEKLFLQEERVQLKKAATVNPTMTVDEQD